MQAAADERTVALEKKIDMGFATMRADFSEMRADSRALRVAVETSERELRGEIISARSDARQDFRTLLKTLFGMWTTTVLAVVGVLLTHA